MKFTTWRIGLPVRHGNLKKVFGMTPQNQAEEVQGYADYFHRLPWYGGILCRDLIKLPDILTNC